jgi:hypothetical protein
VTCRGADDTGVLMFSAYRKVDSLFGDRGDYCCVIVRFKVQGSRLVLTLISYGVGHVCHVIVIVWMEDALSYPGRWVGRSVIPCLGLERHGGCVSPEGSGSSLLHGELMAMMMRLMMGMGISGSCRWRRRDRRTTVLTCTRSATVANTPRAHSYLPQGETFLPWSRE